MILTAVAVSPKSSIKHAAATILRLPRDQFENINLLPILIER